jgi:tetratricopeptide (TPR) repeat protein
MTKRTKKKTHLNSRRSGTPPPKRVLTKGRLWTFRLLTIIVIPALFLGAVELALTVSGYGYPTSYFVKSRIDDQDYLIPNYEFGYRYFPPAMARRSDPYRMPAEKPMGVYRVFVFGESAAVGVPDASYGVSRFLDILLEQRYPNTDFEVICVAVTAINSHAILPIAREVARLDGDLWVIYMGNNEMVGPFGAGTIFGTKAPGLGFVRTSLALRTTHLGQLIASCIDNLGSKSDMPTRWTGINMFKENPLRHDDPKRLRAYENFEGNLEDILNAGQKAGVPVILSTVGSNLKDCSPFISLHQKGLSTSAKSKWETLFRAGRALEKAGKYEAAVGAYAEAAAIDSEYAELQFRMGTCHLALGDTEQARQAFVSARDYDALAVRADTRINQILMDTNFGGDGQVLGVDAEEALAAHSPEGIPGEDFFYEHVHFTAEGNFTLARIIADQVKNLLPDEILASQTKTWMESDACNRKLALTLWDQLRLWQKETKRISIMPFISQTSNANNKDYINRKKNGIKARITKNTWKQDNQWYISALDRAPEDTFLIENYSNFLVAYGKKEEAIEQGEKFRALLPDFAWTHCWLAALLVDAGRLEEARACLEYALEIHNDFTPARELLKRIN